MSLILKWIDLCVHSRLSPGLSVQSQSSCSWGTELIAPSINDRVTSNTVAPTCANQWDCNPAKLCYKHFHYHFQVIYLHWLAILKFLFSIEMFYWWKYAVKSLTPIRIMWYESTDTQKKLLHKTNLQSVHYLVTHIIMLWHLFSLTEMKCINITNCPVFVWTVSYLTLNYCLYNF